jgi:hypothetical protein
MTPSRAELARQRFQNETGPPSNPRRINVYGHFGRKEQAKKWHRDWIDHPAALAEDALH